MKKKQSLVGLLLSIFFIVLQSTVLQNFRIFGVLPDISLIIIVFCSYCFGSTEGEVIGFFSGITQDILSAGPLGFNAFSRTLIGFLYGKFKGKLYLDSVLLPVLFVTIATLLKEILSFLISIALLSNENIFFFQKPFFIELGLNAILAPIVFLIFKLFRIYKNIGKES